MTLEKIKAYLSIDQDYTGDDQLIMMLWNAADEGIKAQLNGGNCDTTDKVSVDSFEARKDIMICMLVSELYNNRELNINSALKQSNVYDLLAIPMTKFSSFG